MLCSVPGKGWREGLACLGLFSPLFWVFSPPGIRACSDFDYIRLIEYELNPKHYSCYRERRSGGGRGGRSGLSHIQNFVGQMKMLF